MKKALVIVMFLLSLLVGAQISLPIQQSNIPKNSLVVDYDFSKSTSFTRGSTTVNNSVGSASGNSSIVNSPIFMNSLGFVTLNGSNQYLVTSNLRPYFKNINSTFQKSFTMSLWVYPTSLNGVIVSELESQVPDPGSGFQYTNIEVVNGFIKYRVYSGTPISSGQTVDLNKWYHIALVYDGATLKAYLNGVLQGSQSYERSAPNSSQNYGIGTGDRTNMGSGAYGAFNLAQFKLYQLPLSDRDIKQEYELRKNEMDYTIHSPSTNSNPTYWSVSSIWVGDNFSLPHYTPWLNSTQAWSAATNNTSQSIILNYDEPVIMKGIVTQGRANMAQWVTSANIDVSLNGISWTRVVSNAVLNSNITDDVRVLFPSTVVAKYVKVSPVTWNLNGHISMRLGVIVAPNPMVTDGLVLHYNPGNLKSYSGTGTAIYDLTANRINGTMSNITYTESSFTYNGASSQISIPDNALLEPGTGSWTMEAWFKPTQFTANSKTVLGKYDNGGLSATISYALRQGDGFIRADFSNGTTAFTSDNYTLSLNNWVQMVYVWDKTNNILYTYSNGVLKQSKAITISGGIRNSATNLYIGSYNGGEYAQYFTGQIGTIRLYNKALNSTEVLKNYNATKDFYEGLELKLDASNTISYPSSGVEWNDISVKGNHATLNNGPVFSPSNGGQFVFDGVNDFASGVAIPSTSGNNSRTVMVWYKSTANKNTVLLDKGGVTDDLAEQLFLVASNSVGVGAGSYPPTNTGGIALCFWGNDFIYPVSSSTLFDGNWHFIAYTYNNTNRSVNICFDGIFASTVYQWNINAWTTLNTKPFISPRVLNTTNNPYWIGQSRAAFWGFGGTFSNLNIPSVSIYSRALTESEILNVYNVTRTRFY